MSPLRPLLAALLLSQTVGAAVAADWQLVLSDRNRRVEIDRGSILSSDAGTKISWGRVVLTSEEARASGYAMIKALNRYDCRNRTFVTVKRVYVDGEDNIVREEPVADQAPLAVVRNSVDERMWREVCNPPSAADLQKLASEAAKLAAAPAASATAPAKGAATPAPAVSASAVAPASPPASTPTPSAAAARPGTPPPARMQSGTVAPAPLAAARPEPAAPPDLVRAGETPPPPQAAAQGAEPPFETHVEIPAKFLPGGSPASGEASAPRKSILPPLPGIAAKTAGEAAAAQQAAPAGASTSKPASAAVSPAAAPAPARGASPAPAPRRPEPPAAAARAEAAKPAVASAPSSATPGPRASAAQPRLGARAQPVVQARPTAARESARADEGRRPSPQAAPTTPSPPALQSTAMLEAKGIRVTTVPAAAAGWSYEGETGPQNWGRLRPEWRVCAEGNRQSPIDLRDGIAVDLAPIQFDYGRSGFRIRDTGNTLQVEVGEGMGITVRGVRYALERFTLHRPSQDRVGGMAHDMAIYLEHRSADGRQAILSVLLAAGGSANPVLQTLWNNLPLDRGREFSPDAVIDLAQLVPADPGHFLYTGSLPTPPCTEDVLWVVMKQPLPIADDQLGVFARLYPRNGRPIQPANGRLLLESR